MAEYKMLDIASLRRDFQDPDRLDEDKVREYANCMARREKIAPIMVRFDGHHYWLQDGFHRVAAAESRGRRKILAEVEPGGIEEMEAEFKQGLKGALRQNELELRRLQPLRIEEDGQ